MNIDIDKLIKYIQDNKKDDFFKIVRKFHEQKPKDTDRKKMQEKLDTALSKIIKTESDYKKIKTFFLENADKLSKHFGKDEWWK